MKKMLDETSRILQLNGLINEIHDQDDIEIDLVIENDDYEIDLVIENDMINEKTPNQKRSGRTSTNGPGSARRNTIYSKGGLEDREPAPKIKGNDDYNEKYNHQMRLKHMIRQDKKKRDGIEEGGGSRKRKSDRTPSTGGPGTPRHNKVYGNIDTLSMRSPAPKKLGSNDHGYDKRSETHRFNLKSNMRADRENIPHGINKSSFVYKKRPGELGDDDMTVTTHNNGFRKLGKK